MSSSQGPVRSELVEVRKKVDLYLSVHRFDAAEKLLKASLADHGPLANLHNLLGVTYHRQSRFVEALQEFQKAWAANGEFIEAALNLAATLCDLSRYDDARDIFQKLGESPDGVRRRQPSLVLGRLANQHAQAGRSYEESGMLTDAIQEYRKGLALFDRMPDVKLALAKLYVRVGQSDKARQEFEELALLAPDEPQAHTWLGILCYKQGQRGEARRHWEKAQHAAPDDHAARAYLKLAHSWSTDGAPAGEERRS